MPPWFVEKNIGIQRFKDDPSLSEEEIAKIAKWADSGAPRGNPADMPPPLDFANADKWTIGEPDLVLRSPEVIVPAVGPDKWGSLGLVPTGLTEDRYVSAVEVREVNDIPRGGTTNTVGGRYGFHHMTYSSVVPGEQPGPRAARRKPAGRFTKSGATPISFRWRLAGSCAANSSLALNAYHLHSNGRETKAHLEFAFKFFPKGYKPLYRRASFRLGNGIDVDVKPNQSQSGAALVRRAAGAHQDHHVRAASARAGRADVPRGDLGRQHPDPQLRGVRPQLGQAVRLRGRCRTAAAEGHHPAPHGFPGHDARQTATPRTRRNWAGGGRRSVANMFLDLGYSVSLTEDQFQAEMAKRRKNLKGKNDYDIGCPLCQAPPPRADAADNGRAAGELAIMRGAAGRHEGPTARSA